jgi:putative oxidoreductase
VRVLEAVSRAALGWVFVQAGAGVLRNPEVPTAKAGPVLRALRTAAPVELPPDVELVRANAAAQVAAGAALVLGIAPRPAAAVLLGSIVPTTAGGHRFWEIEAGPERNTQRNHFLKNISILGGLLHVLITPRRHH